LHLMTLRTKGRDVKPSDFEHSRDPHSRPYSYLIGEAHLTSYGILLLGTKPPDGDYSRP